ncbi:MAG: threonylcarbamoyl-AMP synthase [Actinobacteria bacterium]|nr:threonylcarbamoyl-AMP synthase [Actinomycetota bacterium]
MDAITVSLITDRDEAIKEAGLALRAGRLVVFPTDTVYGIAADAFNQAATSTIFRVKNRPRSLPLPVLVSRPRQAWALSSEVPPGALDLAGSFWPGALTMILKQADELEWDLGESRGTIAVRMPAHQDLIALLENVGPTAMTSANVSGEPTPRTVDEIRARLGDEVAVYVDGGPSSMDTGSTIVDLTGSVARVLREGPISSADVARAIGPQRP